MTEPLPPTNPAGTPLPPVGETLLEVTAPADETGPGRTLLALDAGTGNESVLSRLERATGAGLHSRPIELQTGDLNDGSSRASQAPTRPVANDFSSRASGSVRAGARYVSATELGRGGMGVVLRVRDTDLRRDVAMKVVRADRAQAGTPNGNAVLRRFIEEAQITGQLEHPNIVPVHELGADADGRVYFTMKLVRGRPLNDVIRALRAGDPATRDEYPLDRLLQVFLKICDALSFAHAHNVIHRDLKPENIMLGRYGEVLVMDWGLARILNQPEAPGVESAGGIETDSSQRKLQGDTRPSALSMEGTIAGTPAYMAPEQARGQVSRIDQTTDVFALGAILYELLVLRPPYQGEGGTQIIERAAEGEYPPSARAARDPELRALLARLPGGRVPPELEAVAMHALAYLQSRRYPTVRALKEDVENYLAGRPVSVRRDPPAVRAARWVRRHPTLSMSTAAACAVVLVSVAAILFLVAQARQEALEQEGQLLAASKLAEDEAQRRARAESQTAARERELKDAALAREQALARRARAAEIFRVGTEQAERARDITDPALRDATRAEAADTLQRATRADEAYMDPWFALARLHHFFLTPRALDCYGRVDQLARADGAPGDARSLVYAGDFARLYLRDTKAARDFYERAGKIAPDDPLALVGRGYVELLDGDFGAALDLARRARELEGSLWEPYLLEGLVRASVFVHDDRALNRHFDPEQAEQLLTQGLLRNSREGVLYNERGTARLELGRIADALADFERACERMPGAVEPRVNVSIAMMRQARLGEALAMVEPLTAEFPRHVQVWMQYGTVLLMLSRYDEGILALNRSLELRPGRPAPLTNLSLAETWRGDYARAEQYAQQALAAEPGVPQAHIALCEARQGLKQYDAALQSAEAALALRPNWGVAEIARAKTLVMLGRFDDALGCARRAVKSQPEFDEAWAALGMAEQGLRNWPTAIEHHTRAVEINPRNSMARLNLAICLKMQGRVADALPHAEEACAQRALGARPHFEVASCLMLLGRTEQALARFLKAAEIEPTFGDAWINAALCANKLNRPKEARDHALQATRCRPDHVLSWVQLCQSEIYLKDFEAANRAVDKAKELATEDPAARCDVAAMLYTLGRNDEALAVAREVAALAEGYARPWELMANIHIRQKKFEDALKARAEQARRDPENPAPWVSSAALLYELGRHEEAVNAGKRALALDPNNAEAHNQIGHARQELKQYDLAIESYEAAARANKQDAWPWFNIGVARIRQNRIADAAAAFEQCVKVNPKNEKAQWTLGLCCKNLGRWPQAQAAFAAAFALNPRNAAAAQEAGIAAIENAEFETAQEFGHKASQLAPDQWLSWYVLGRAHFEQGQHASAAKALNKAVALETKTPTLYRLLAVAQSELAEYEAARQAAENVWRWTPKDADSPLVLARVALAHDNKPEVALAWLRKALENGADREFVVSRPWAAPLHDSDGWKQLLKDFPG